MRDERDMGIQQVFAENEIIVLVPTTYTRGFIKFSLEYIIDSRPTYVNHVHCPRMTMHYQYDKEEDHVSLVPNNTVIGNMNIAMQYMQHVYNHLGAEGKKSIPMSLGEFVAKL